MPAFADDMPVELWVLYLMPSCEKHIDGFASKSEAPYAHWRQNIQPPDPRFASPEDTWNLFLQASLSGDKATVAECFSAVVRAKYMSFIDQLTPEQLAKTA